MPTISGGQVIQGARSGILTADLGSPAAPAAAGVLAAVTDDGTEQTITSSITNPSEPRSITATAGGTAGDIAAVQVVVNGTNAEGDAITETLPAFTVNTAGTVEGAKAFATVTSVVIPAHDGTGATTSIGTGSKLGLGAKLARDTVLRTWFGDVVESTAPTVAADADDIEGNTVDLDSTLDGSAVIVDYWES